MREVAVIGIGQTKIDEHWDKSLRELAGFAVLDAVKDAGLDQVDSLYVGNMMSASANHQAQLGAYIADWVGLRYAESFKVESACSSGAAAFRTALMAVAFMTSNLWGSESSEYERVRMSFTNFVRCELTRTNATDHFKGKPFEITMVSLFDAVQEGEILIVTGAVDCFVQDKHVTLYAAVGIRTLMGRAKVDFFVVRKQDFTILATELMESPYKERCDWTQYWIDIN